jgi:hypothetical protein
MIGNPDSKVESFKDAVYTRSATAARTETETPWPGIADPYRAAGNADSDGIARLVVVMGGDRFKPGDQPAYYTLLYHDMGTGEYGFGADGQWFRIPFHESGRSRLLEARGRSILRIGDYISLSRMPWIRLADRDFRPGDGADADAPIFTHISVEEVTEGD